MGRVDALCRANSSNRILKSKEEKPEWLDVWQVAALLCQSFNAVNKLSQQGGLPFPSTTFSKGKSRQSWRKADILEWDAIGRPSAEEFRDLRELAKRKAMAFFEALPFKPLDGVVSKYR